MPLPQSSTPWPPPQLQKILPAMAVWDAWYTGDPNKLSSTYGGSNDLTSSGFYASDVGGFKNAVGKALARWFWGEATRGPDRRMKLHVPIAADLCQASADLLFADQVSLQVDNPATQSLLDTLADDGLHTKLAEAAEIAAALGGVYLRVTWDESIADRAFLTSVDSDQALPEFAWDRLRAVTFWQVVARDGQQVWRHLERHELDSNGDGVILHGLYQGDDRDLGHLVPLTDQNATAPLAMLVDTDSKISTQSPGLAVVYVPNQRPQRRWRTDPTGKSLGRSDLDGIEGLMDALDETYSSWMRDIRLGKSRVMVARSLLESNGKGAGSSFDADQEIYSPLTALSKADQTFASQMQQVQFKIRYEEHAATAQQLVEDILRTAGYSSQTFGEGEVAQRTATEVEQKERRSLMTRDRKVRLWKPAVAQAVTKLLLVNAAVFSTPVTLSADGVEVTWPDGVQESQLNLANTALSLAGAGAASTRTLVEMVHPEWDEDDVAAEVALIQSEKSITEPPDPAGNPFLNPDDPTGAAAS